MREYIIAYTGKQLDSLVFVDRVKASGPEQAIKAYLRHIHQESTIDVREMKSRKLGAIPASALSTYDAEKLLNSTKLDYKR